MLTSAVNELNGYGVVSRALRDALAAKGAAVQVFTKEKAASRRFNPDSLKSELADAYPCLAPLFFLHDVVNVLWLLRGKVDVIHVMVEHYAFTGMILSWILRAPYVITAHGTYCIHMPRRFALIRLAFRRADSLVAISRYTARRLREEGFRHDAEVVNWGVDRGTFSPEPGVPRGKLVTFVGNFKPRKGLFFLLDAFRIVNRQDPEVKLLVMGKLDNGPAEYPKAAALVREWGLNVDFMGYVETARQVDQYRRARLNVLPSKSDPAHFEGFGLIHLEANACGTLSLGTLGSGNEDAVREGCGWLIAYGDAEALAARILEAMTMEPYPAIDTEAVRGWDAVAEDYLALYRKCREVGVPDAPEAASLPASWARTGN